MRPFVLPARHVCCKQMETMLAKVLMSNDMPLSPQEVLVIASGGTPDAAVAGLLTGFRKARSVNIVHAQHTQ